MKAKHLLLVLLAVFFSQNNLPAQNGKAQNSRPPAKIKSAAFSGVWKGSEKCTVQGAPVAIVTVLTNGPSAVLVSGIYSISGKIKGTIKGNQVIFELQEIQDPNFQNLAISGSLTLSDNRRSLVARIEVQNNNTRDECTATYQKTDM